MQPGQTITPGQQPEQETPHTEQPAPPTPIQSEPTASKTESTTPTLETPPAEVTPISFTQESEQPAAPQLSNETVRWTASEYIDHAKGPAWFALMGLGLFVMVTLVYFLLKDVLAAVLVALAGITFGVFAGRRPQVLEYSISQDGLSIGQRTHLFSEFKSFSLVDSGPLPSILLMPLKRFLPPITIFYDPNEEDKIINALANFLPHEEREPDMVDRLMSRIRF